MYYLQSRYYDPVLCRFISPASALSVTSESLDGLNLYVYANNNPINIQYKTSLTSSASVGEEMINSVCASTIVRGGTSSSGLSLRAMPEWIKYSSSALDVFSSFAGVLEISVWSVTSSGRAFSDFHYVAYGINRFTQLDKLTSPLRKACKGISVGLIFADLGMDVYNSLQQGYSFAQGATSFVLTAAKDIGIYYASTGVASAVGGYIAGSKLGTALGSWGGPVGMIIGAVVGFAVGYIIDEFGNVIIDWAVGLCG